MSDTPNPTDPPAGDPPANVTTNTTLNPIPVTINTANPQPAEKTFDQAQLDRIVGTRTKDAEKAALEKAASDLGVSLADAKKIITAHQEKANADKTEAEKLKEENERLKQESATEIQTTREESYADRVQNRLVRADLPKTTLEDDDALAILTGVVRERAPIGSTVEDIDAAIVFVKNKLPQLFAVTKEDPKGNPPSNPGGAPRKAPVNLPDPKSEGEKFADQFNARRGVPTRTP